MGHERLHRIDLPRRCRTPRWSRCSHALGVDRTLGEVRRVRYTEQRVVERGKIITSAGVSSGIDMALTLLARVDGPEVAQAVQLAIEYDPQPPFDAGSTAKAPPEIVDLVRVLLVEAQDVA